MELPPVHQKAEGSIPGQGMYRRQQVSVSLSRRCFSLSLHLSLKSANIASGYEKDLKKRYKKIFKKNKNMMYKGFI